MSSITGASMAKFNKEIEGWQLSRLKNGCLITIISLLESLDIKENIMQRVMRTI